MDQSANSITDWKGGYDPAIFLSSPPDHMRCSFCKRILRDARQLNCGDRVCASCLTDIFSASANRYNSLPKCPADDVVIQKEEVFRDVFAQKEVDSQIVRCPSRVKPSSSSTCHWQGELHALKAHEEVCQFTEWPCPNGCGETVRDLDLIEHKQRLCIARLVQCQHCGEQIPFKNIAAHLEASCIDAPIPCPNGCTSRLMPKQHMAEHLKKCQKQIVKCVYNPMGCSYEGTRDSLPHHHDVDMAFHLQICFQQAQQNQRVVNHLGKENKTLAERCSSLEKNFSRLEALLEGNLARTFPSPSYALSETSAADVQSVTRYMPGYDEATVARLEGPGELVSMRQAVLANEQRVTSAERALGLLDIQLSELNIRQDLQEVKTTNGVFVWKISDFHRRQQDAISGKTPSLYSPPFYTSSAGYKVCARVYLHGDGVGRGTHLSLFFVVMRGEFDALLPWPFRQKVTLMLLDQNRANTRDVIETFRPDPNSSSFQRPEHEMNVASGCPLFLPLSALEHSTYLQNDTLYFKIIVNQQGLQAPDKM